jgi:AcrR family transcriptional regulator
MTRQEANKARILEAALVCFETAGAANTTMADIAKAAGLGRKTLYRVFATRSDLLDALAVQRAGVFVGLVKAVVDRCPTLEQALIKGAIESLRLVRSDKVFMAIVENAAGTGFERYLIGPASPIVKAMLSIWTDAFATARARNEWRPGLTNLEAVTWLAATHLILLLRDDLSAKRQVDFLKKFVLPAMLPG